MKSKNKSNFLPCHSLHQNLLGGLLGSAPHISRLNAMLVRWRSDGGGRYRGFTVPSCFPGFGEGDNSSCFKMGSLS